MREVDYLTEERLRAAKNEEKINIEPLVFRREAQAEWLLAMQERPDVIAKRIGWLLDGHYGNGQYQRAKQILEHTRMNRIAALSQEVALWEWHCPKRMAADAWKKLTKEQQDILAVKIQAVIDGQ